MMVFAEQRATDGGTLLQRIDFEYDVFGNRIEKSVTTGSTTVQRFSWDGRDIWADLDGSSSLTTRRVFGDGVNEPLARIAGGAEWYLQDRMGSVRDIVNSAGAVVAHATYDAWGLVTGSSGSTDRYLAFGYQLDAESGLYYVMARYMDPVTHLFLQQDPIDADINAYRYAGNSPTNATDPSGLAAGPHTLLYRGKSGPIERPMYRGEKTPLILVSNDTSSRSGSPRGFVGQVNQMPLEDLLGLAAQLRVAMFLGTGDDVLAHQRLQIVNTRIAAILQTTVIQETQRLLAEDKTEEANRLRGALTLATRLLAMHSSSGNSSASSSSSGNATSQACPTSPSGPVGPLPPKLLYEVLLNNPTDPTALSVYSAAGAIPGYSSPGARKGVDLINGEWRLTDPHLYQTWAQFEERQKAQILKRYLLWAGKQEIHYHTRPFVSIFEGMGQFVAALSKAKPSSTPPLDSGPVRSVAGNKSSAPPLIVLLPFINSPIIRTGIPFIFKITFSELTAAIIKDVGEGFEDIGAMILNDLTLHQNESLNKHVKQRIEENGGVYPYVQWILRGSLIAGTAAGFLSLGGALGGWATVTSAWARCAPLATNLWVRGGTLFGGGGLATQQDRASAIIARLRDVSTDKTWQEFLTEAQQRLAVVKEKYGDIVAYAKRIDLPSWKKLSIDWVHVSDRHMEGGKYVDVGKKGRDVFYGLNKTQVERVIRGAYQGDTKKLATQGDRVLIRGSYDGWTVEMWVNTATNVIETAYPLGTR